MLEINQQPVWFPNIGPGAVLPGTAIGVKSALTFAGEMLTRVQICRGDADSCAEFSASAGSPSWGRREREGWLRGCWLLAFPLKSRLLYLCVWVYSNIFTSQASVADRTSKKLYNKSGVWEREDWNIQEVVKYKPVSSTFCHPQQNQGMCLRNMSFCLFLPEPCVV